jgi:hypothetical protein
MPEVRKITTHFIRNQNIIDCKDANYGVFFADKKCHIGLIRVSSLHYVLKIIWGPILMFVIPRSARYLSKREDIFSNICCYLSFNLPQHTK